MRVREPRASTRKIAPAAKAMPSPSGVKVPHSMRDRRAGKGGSRSRITPSLRFVERSLPSFKKKASSPAQAASPGSVRGCPNARLGSLAAIFERVESSSAVIEPCVHNRSGAIEQTAGIAWINSLGNLGGFFGPNLLGTVKTAAGSYDAAFFVIAGLAFIAVLVSLRVRAMRELRA